ncbi:hypothetical protein J1614_006367 [Plenodomus biglobosus]|nr:hypothetical protein J1614_006367 [Plenodomus biglobosus]
MQESVIQWPLGLDIRDLVGAGITATVARLDAVVNIFQPSELGFREREKRIYQRLGRDHSGIVRHLSDSVLHGDLSCNHVLLDENLDVKLGDFAGSVIDDLPSLICYETSHEVPDQDNSAKTEIFALGSTIYEIMTGLKPYQDLPDHEVSAAFSEGRYPDLKSISVFKNRIMNYWAQSFTTVEEALQDVQLEGKLNSPPKSQYLTIANWPPFQSKVYPSRPSSQPSISFVFSTYSCCIPRPCSGRDKASTSIMARKTLASLPGYLDAGHSVHSLRCLSGLEREKPLGDTKSFSIFFCLLTLIPCCARYPKRRGSMHGKMRYLTHVNCHHMQQVCQLDP